MQVTGTFYSIYIVTNFNRTVLYTGITNNLEQRIIEHYLNGETSEGFTGRYKAFYLIYYETYRYVNDAIAREKEIKGWKRDKKLELIRAFNPNLEFLNNELLGEWPPKNMFHRKNLK